MWLMPSRAAAQEAADGRPLLLLCVKSYQNRSAICGETSLGIFRRWRTTHGPELKHSAVQCRGTGSDIISNTRDRKRHRSQEQEKNYYNVSNLKKDKTKPKTSWTDNAIALLPPIDSQVVGGSLSRAPQLPLTCEQDPEILKLLHLRQWWHNCQKLKTKHFSLSTPQLESMELFKGYLWLKSLLVTELCCSCGGFGLPLRQTGQVIILKWKYI